MGRATVLSIDIHIQRGRFQLDACFCSSTIGITALLGRSGAGKTTIINAIAGLVRPDAGRIVVGDRVLFDHRRKITLSPSQRQIGYVFQEAQLFPHMSVRDNLLYGWRRQCKSYPDHRSISFEAVITLMDLYHLLAERPVHLSGGEKQRVTIGRALLSQPSLLLLDEPLAALDTPRRDEILPYLECLSTELWLPMIYVSHSLDEVLHLADHLVLIENGQILVSGSPQVVLTDDIFCKMYGSNDFGTILEAEVRGEEENLTTLKVGEWLLRIPKIPSSCGTRLTLHIRARNVILSKSAPMALSLINTVQGTIIGIQSQVSEARIHLDIKGVTLIRSDQPLFIAANGPR